MRTITALFAASVLLVAACGDDDDNAGTTTGDAATADTTAGSASATTTGQSATGVQAQAADELIKQANDSNLSPDEGCIRDKAAKLSDDDAQKIVDSGTSGTPDLSPEGIAIVAAATTCISASAVVDSIVKDLPQGVDADCVRDKLKDANFGDILSSGTMPPELQQAIKDCGTG
jgi:hypothetical protein